MRSNLNPEQIRALPLRRDLPLNGLTPEQVVAIGGDPDAVEAARLASNEFAAEQQMQQNVQIVLAAEQAVAEGDMTPVQAAAELAARGLHTAHDAFVARRLEAEAQEAAEEQSDWLEFAPMSEYAQFVDAHREAQREQAEVELQLAGDAVAKAKFAEMVQQFHDYVASTPGAHLEAPAVEQRLAQMITESDAGLGAIPDTPEARARMIAQATHQVSVRDNLSAGLVEQVNVEWRAQEARRREEQFTGRRSDERNPQQRAADEAAWKEQRLEELGNSIMVDRSVLELGPTAAELSAAETAKYVEREQKSTSFHEQVAGISERGYALGRGDRGQTISEERKAYKDAMARAEREALYGESAEVKTGYGEEHAAGRQLSTKSGMLDEFGGAFPGYEDA